MSEPTTKAGQKLVRDMGLGARQGSRAHLYRRERLIAAIREIEAEAAAEATKVALRSAVAMVGLEGDEP